MMFLIIEFEKCVSISIFIGLIIILKISNKLQINVFERFFKKFSMLFS
jgi:hypothetical protein